MAKKYVETLNLDGIAITNHDFLNLENYNEIVEELGSDIKVFPGAEVKLKGGHLLVIAAPEDAEYLSEGLVKLKQIKNLKGRLPAEEDFIEAIPRWKDFILIPDSAKSKKYTSDSENSQLQEKFIAGDMGSAKAFNKQKKLSEGLTPVLFGDLHATDYNDKNDYSRVKTTYIESSSLEIPILKLALLNKKNVSIVKNPSDRINEAQFMIHGKVISGSDSENLIIGKRGSGKTHFINDLKKSNSNKILYIKQGELVKDSTEKEFYDGLKNSNQKITEEFMDKYKPVFSEAFKLLADKSTPGQSINYLQSIKEFALQSNETDEASKVPLFSSPEISHKIPVGLKGIVDSLNQLLKVKNETYKNIISNYIDETDLEELTNIFRAERRMHTTQREISKIADDIRRSVRNELDKVSSQTIPDPDNFNLLGWFGHSKRIALLDEYLKNEVVRPHEIYKVKVGNYFTLKISARPFENASEFLEQMGRNESVQEEFTNYYLNKKYWDFLEAISNKNFFSKAKIWQYFLKVEYELLNQNKQMASGGERAEYALLNRLEDAHNYELVLIDEPEASFDNPFLTNQLLPMINQISQHATVFVITHSSSVGALMHPNYIYITKLLNKDYNIFSGWFETGEVMNINTGDTESLYDNLIELMESGNEHWDEKGILYENLKKSEDNNKGLFLNSENQYQDILQIDNNELLNLANRLYENVNELPNEDELLIEEIRNPISKIVMRQIYAKLLDFKDNVAGFNEELDNIYSGRRTNLEDESSDFSG